MLRTVNGNAVCGKFTVWKIAQVKEISILPEDTKQEPQNSTYLPNSLSEATKGVLSLPKTGLSLDNQKDEKEWEENPRECPANLR